MSAIVIKTDHWPKPIPVRGFDWVAWYDGEEETGCNGYGATEDAAINDLLDTYPREDVDLASYNVLALGRMLRGEAL